MVYASKSLCFWKHKFLLGLSVILGLCMGEPTAFAQVAGDQTLSSNENTQVNFTNSDGIYEITGGAIRGD